MRPTEPPAEPYTAKQILDGIYQHFIVEGNPKGTGRYGTGCYYSDTELGKGCAVGCMMPNGHAKQWDSLGLTIGGVFAARYHEYRMYFRTDDYEMLKNLQWTHDRADDRTFRDDILEVLNKWATNKALPGYTMPTA